MKANLHRKGRSTVSAKSFLCRRSKRLTHGQLEEVYAKLRQAFGWQDWWPGDTAFEIMVGAILTQNTAWSNVEKAILNLKRAKILTPSAMRKIPIKKLAALIRPAGYFNVKANRLKNFLRFVFERYQGRLSRMRRRPLAFLRSELLEVNGIGPETADSILLYALEKPSFVIDAYTKRIFSRHGLLPVETSYEEWRQLFMTHLPVQTRLFNDYHAQIVNLAKTHCRTKPNCLNCPLEAYL